MRQHGQGGVRLGDEVAAALLSGRPVVALETSIVAHGLPRPDNLAIGRGMAAAVAAAGAVPALTAVADGAPRLGLDDATLVDLAEGGDVAKASWRDLARLAAAGAMGGTTVAGTAALAAAAGVRVMATGGIGGVHAGAGFDVSADLEAIARLPLIVVCAGAKSILDLAATLERLESLNVPVLGWRTERFPAFYTIDSGLPVPSVASVDELARLARGHWALGGGGLVLAQAPPVPIDPAALERWTAQAHAVAASRGITGAAVTPFVLAELARASGGRTVAANRALVLANAALAARAATALAADGGDG